MTCQTCGRPAENGQATHWLGCEVPILKAKAAQARANPQPPATSEAPDGKCEHGGCSELKKEWAGKGAKPKYCAAGHKKEKS
jgi:hypothetical protein